jgi:RNA polymerase sigma factor (TIGR02999 family)
MKLADLFFDAAGFAIKLRFSFLTQRGRSSGMPASDEVTLILQRVNAGEAEAHRELFAAVYDELRRRAELYMSQERADHTLQPTALVNEAFVRLINAPTAKWDGSRHFYAAVAEAMRQILVDHARRKKTAKRGGGRNRVPLDGEVKNALAAPASGPRNDDGIDYEALDKALDKLKALDERRYDVVMYRYFAGVPEVKIAEILDISESTVRRDWQTAKLFLLAELTTP